MTTKKITKKDLIQTLVDAGAGRHVALQRLTHDALVALVADLPAKPEPKAEKPAEEPTPAAPALPKVKAETLAAGMTIVGTRKREPIRKIGKVSVGAKWVTCWDEKGKDFAYVAVGTKVEVVA